MVKINLENNKDSEFSDNDLSENSEFNAKENENLRINKNEFGTQKERTRSIKELWKEHAYAKIPLAIITCLVVAAMDYIFRR